MKSIGKLWATGFGFLVLVTVLAAGYANADRCAGFDELVGKVRAVRGLEPLKPLSCRESAEAEIRSSPYFIEAVQAMQKWLSEDEVIYKILGFVPEAYPYRQCVLHLGAPTPDALYVGDTGVILVNQRSRSAPERLVMEIVRALQDQHFQSREKERASRVSTDRSLALRGVLDGEGIHVARQVTNAWTIEESTAPAPVVELAAGCFPPQSLLFISEFPQQFGSLLVGAARRKNEAEGENLLMQKPPTSTKQVLYKTDFADAPLEMQPVPVPQLPEVFQNKLFTLAHEDILGEYFIRTLLREYLGSASALNAARGWTGDHVGLYKNPKGDHLLLWESRWISRDDAREFFQAFRISLGIRYNVDIARTLESFVFQSGNQTRYEVKLNGKEVSIVALRG